MKQRQTVPQTAQTPARPQVDTAPMLDALQALEASGQMAQGMGNGFLAQEAQLHQAFEGTTTSLPHQAQLEAVYGRDLSDVRVVDGAELLDDMGVAAVARDGAIALGSQADFDTVAHEVAHVVQFEQHGSGAGIGASSGAAEKEADQAMAAARDGNAPTIEARPDGELQCRLLDQARFLALTANDTFDFSTGEPIAEMETAEHDEWYEAAEWVWDALWQAEQANATWDALSELMQNGELHHAMEQGQAAVDQMDAVFEAVRKLSWIGDTVTEAITALLDEEEDQDSEYNELRRAVQYGDLKTYVDWHAQAGRYMEPGVQQFLEAAWACGQDAQETEAALNVYKQVYAASTPIDIGELDAEQDVQALLAERTESEAPDLSDSKDGDAWHYLWPAGMSRPGGDDIGCRIYCNVHPSVAAAFAVQVADALGAGGEVVEGGRASALKVVIGEDVGKRCDSVVVYVRQNDGDERGALNERDRILAEIARICASDLDPESADRLPAVPGATGTWADAMLEELPGMTRRVTSGVATAEHPQDERSFGQTVSAAVQEALEEALELGLVEDQFVQLALTRMAEAGIDPSAPWRVGPTAPKALKARVQTVEDVFDPRRGRVLYRRAMQEMEAGDRGGVELDAASLQELLAEMAAV